MKKIRNTFLYLFLLLFTSFLLAQKQPNVVILATGGTIAGAGESSTNASYTSGQVGIETMIDAVPGIRKLAQLKGEQISNVGSQDMSIDIWLKLAKRINELLSNEGVDGIVITHGTDTMEETAYFLDLVIHSDKPIVMTGSMRPSTAVSAEGPLNLYNAVAVAASKKTQGHGVMIVMNDQILEAHAAIKANTTAVQTFIAPGHGLLGTVLYGEIDLYHQPHGIHTSNSVFSIGSETNLPRVDIIYTCVSCSTELLTEAIKSGAKGIVIAGVGNGNMSKEMLEIAEEASKKGIMIVRSTRVPSGEVVRNAEVNDDENLTIASDELNPQKARILLMLALKDKKTRKEIQVLMKEY